MRCALLVTLAALAALLLRASAKDIAVNGDAGWYTPGALASRDFRAGITHPLRRAAAVVSRERRAATVGKSASSLGPNKEFGPEFPPITADVGDTIVFRWVKGQHAVVELPDEAKYTTCARLAMESRAGPQDTPFNFVVPRPGTFFFGCPVANHCELGQKIRVVANAP